MSEGIGYWPPWAVGLKVQPVKVIRRIAFALHEEETTDYSAITSRDSRTDALPGLGDTDAGALRNPLRV